jgi:hypothetical protein
MDVELADFHYNLLFRWFMGLNMDDAIWDASTFSKNRERLLEGEVAHAFFEQVLAQARERALLSEEHFPVDGTLIEAWAGQKSFKRTDGMSPTPPDDPGTPSIDFRGERRTNATHASTTDPEARLYKKAKGQEAKLAYRGPVLMENRHGLVVDTCITQATGTAEREAAVAMAEAIPGQQRVTLGADKNDGTRDVVHELRERCDAACDAEYHGSVECHRWPDDSPSGLCGEPAETPMRGRELRLDENDRTAAQDPVSRCGADRMDVHLCRCCGVQPGADAHAGGRGMSPRESREAQSLPHLSALTPTGGATLVRHQRSSHPITGIWAAITVELRNGVFQQPARRRAIMLVGC